MLWLAAITMLNDSAVPYVLRGPQKVISAEGARRMQVQASTVPSTAPSSSGNLVGSAAGRRLLAAAVATGASSGAAAGPDDVRRRADALFAGFMMLGVADLALLLLFGVAHPRSRAKAPRVYLSGVEQPRACHKDGTTDAFSLQARAVAGMYRSKNLSLKPCFRAQHSPSVQDFSKHEIGLNVPGQETPTCLQRKQGFWHSSCTLSVLYKKHAWLCSPAQKG